MRFLLLPLFIGLSVMGSWAEDWTTQDGKTYHDVKVLSHDAAYVTILDRNGGGRILIGQLSPALQKRFDYDPAQAAKAIAATAAADQQDQAALAREKAASAANAAAGQQAVDAAVALATLPPPPGSDLPPPAGSPSAAAPPPDLANEGPVYGPSEIDDYDYGYYGGYGYVGYPYGYGRYSIGYRGGGHRPGTATMGRGFNYPHAAYGGGPNYRAFSANAGAGGMRVHH